MGCDVHIVIQCKEPNDTWREVPWQRVYEYPGARQAVPGVPIAPDQFSARNYDLFALLADVRNGQGFAGIRTGEGWPSLAPARGWPDDFDSDTVEPNPTYPEGGPRYLGDHSFTWVDLEELKTLDWDGIETWLYGVVPAEEYERLTLAGEAPQSYCGDISGPGVQVYEPDEYRQVKAIGKLVEYPHVRMGWPTTAREATWDWPGAVIPWLDALAEGRPLRLILGFDS